MESGNRSVVFFGTAGICIPFLEKLQEHFDLRLIITQPDALGGRRKQKLVPPVKEFAQKNGIDFLQPEVLKDEALVERIKEAAPAIGVVVAYGKIIPKALFTIPERRTINVHFSLLPLYRGAAPVQRALENGEKQTGITIFQINRKMDSGDIWAQRAFAVLADDTTASLWQRLSREGAPFLVETIRHILDGTIEKRRQDHERATYASAVQKEEGKVDWRLSAGQIHDRLRAFTPWPGLYCVTGGKLFKLTKLRALAGTQNGASLPENKKPGDVLSMDREGLRVCCGQGTVIEILTFQPQGKKEMTPFDYCLGNRLPDHLE